MNEENYNPFSYQDNTDTTKRFKEYIKLLDEYNKEKELYEDEVHQYAFSATQNMQIPLTKEQIDYLTKMKDILKEKSKGDNLYFLIKYQWVTETLTKGYYEERDRRQLNSLKEYYGTT